MSAWLTQCHRGSIPGGGASLPYGAQYLYNQISSITSQLTFVNMNTAILNQVLYITITINTM
jgi:hypothetical protein